MKIEIDVAQAARSLALAVLAAAMFGFAYVIWFQDDVTKVRTEVAKESAQPTAEPTTQASTANSAPVVAGVTATPEGTAVTRPDVDRTVTTEETTGTKGIRSEVVTIALLTIAALLAMAAIFGDKIQTLKGGGIEVSFRDIKDIRDEASIRLEHEPDPERQIAVARALLVALDRALDVGSKEADHGSR